MTDADPRLPPGEEKRGSGESAPWSVTKAKPEHTAAANLLLPFFLEVG